MTHSIKYIQVYWRIYRYIMISWKRHVHHFHLVSMYDIHGHRDVWFWHWVWVASSHKSPQAIWVSNDLQQSPVICGRHQRYEECALLPWLPPWPRAKTAREEPFTHLLTPRSKSKPGSPCQKSVEAIGPGIWHQESYKLPSRLYYTLMMKITLPRLLLWRDILMICLCV